MRRGGIRRAVCAGIAAQVRAAFCRCGVRGAGCGHDGALVMAAGPGSGRCTASGRGRGVITRRPPRGRGAGAVPDGAVAGSAARRCGSAVRSCGVHVMHHGAAARDAQSGIRRTAGGSASRWARCCGRLPVLVLWSVFSSTVGAGAGAGLRVGDPVGRYVCASVGLYVSGSVRRWSPRRWCSTVLRVTGPSCTLTGYFMLLADLVLHVRVGEPAVGRGEG